MFFNADASPLDQARSGSLSQVLTATKALKEHRADVAKSRALEEALRTTWPAVGQKPILCLMTDGMDQAHWAVPRLPKWRGPKKFAEGKIRRPRCKVQGAWCFFYNIHIVVADPVMPHDSSFTAEVVMRTLERCRVVAQEKGLPYPRELCLWTDNTVRENKNVCILLLLASMVGRAQFDLTMLLNHQKGHTHNILDQCFGIVARCFQSIDTLEDPSCLLVFNSCHGTFFCFLLLLKLL